LKTLTVKKLKLVSTTVVLVDLLRRDGPGAVMATADPNFGKLSALTERAKQPLSPAELIALENELDALHIVGTRWMEV